jgi:hypothetical protein
MKTKLLQMTAVATAMLLAAAGARAQTNIGQWDFNGSLSQSAGSNLGDMTYLDGTSGATASNTVFGTTSSFAIPNINGTNAQVMKYAGHVFPEGYLVPTPPPNGGGSLVNDYTFIVDYLTPTNGIFRPLLQMDDGTLDHINAFLAIGIDGSLQVTNTSGVSLPSGFFGNVVPNTWYRLGFVLNQDAGQVSVYTNGSKAGSFAVPTGVTHLDSPYALFSGNLPAFSGPTTNAAGYVNSLQLRDVSLNDGQMAALGGPSAAGIPIIIPPVHTFIQARFPDVGQSSVTPVPSIHVELNEGDSTLNNGSISLALDGTVVPATQGTLSTNVITLDYTGTNILDPLSIHTLTLVYQDSFSSPAFVTNSWTFTIAAYQSVFLPAVPIYSENFDEIAEGTLPAGWSVTNATFQEESTVVYDLNDTQSASYLNWAVLSTTRYAAVYADTDNYTSPGQPNVSGNRRQMIPPIVVNGVLLTNLASGNLIVAESDQRSNNGQVQALFTKDYDLTGITNSYVSFYMLNEQNQDNICCVEYSIDQGAHWLPLLYMLDDGTTDGDGSDVVTNATTGMIDVFATFNTVRSDQAPATTNLVNGQTVPAAYGAFVGAPITTNLIPFIRPCRNDDPVQQKRIEIFRLAQGDGQSHVRFRFMQAGTSSWYFDIDNFAIYSINTPVISSQPQSVNVNGNTPASFTVVATGSGTLTYQWYFNGLKINGATNSTYTIASATLAQVGQYQVIVQNADGPTKSAIANLTINTTPAFTTEPVGELADVGATVSLVSVATGAVPLNFQWYSNSVAIPGATAATLTFPNIQTGSAGIYSVSVSNSFGGAVSANATVKVFSGALSNLLVVHLTFDGDFSDSSGRGNNASYATYGAAASPTARFTNGFLGQSFEYTTTSDRTDVEYATLGYPTDLQFGDSTDFSVSFWASYTNQADDPAFLSNKDWNSSSNPGWGIFTQGGGNYRINVTGPNQGSDKYSQTDTPQTLKDGNWHHIAVSIQRAPFGSSAFVYGYQDGVLVSKHAMNTAGTIDTLGLPFGNSQGVTDSTNVNWAVNIGQDGTGVYTDGGSAHNINARIDDLGIWRRGITANEVKGIYKEGLAGRNLSQAFGLLNLNAVKVGSTIHLSWAGAANLKIQTSPVLGAAAVWTDVPGTLGASSAIVNITGTSAYFRVESQ